VWLREQRVKKAWRPYEQARILAEHPEWLRRDRSGPQQKYAVRVRGLVEDRVREAVDEVLTQDPMLNDRLNRAFGHGNADGSFVEARLAPDTPRGAGSDGDGDAPGGAS
jgi:hypothetical protein